MKVLGVDPGIGTTGFGLIRQKSLNSFVYLHCGCLKTPPRTPLEQRLLQLSQDFAAMLEEFKPDCAAVEKLFFGRNVTTAFSVGQARGVLLLELARRHIPMAEYSPPQVKQAVAGYGAAQKRQVQSMVKRLLNLKTPPRPDDAADALALALCHSFSAPMRNLKKFKALASS